MLAESVGPEGLDPDAVLITLGAEQGELEARALAAAITSEPLPVLLELVSVSIIDI
jgi:hypothetical protein